jgi:hypothetical protein
MRGCALSPSCGAFPKEGTHPKEDLTSLGPCVAPPIHSPSHRWHIVELRGVVSLIPLTLVTHPLPSGAPSSIGIVTLLAIYWS